MAQGPLPKNVDVVVVGNGPSALILSFILHGNIPYYDTTNPHPDTILHKKLSKSTCLLDVDVHDLTSHFAGSRLSYSTQALPINVLLDTLLRPLADTEPGAHQSCVQWRYESERAVPHVVLGNTPNAGGQWADDPVAGNWNIRALSYSEMISLPAYSFADHFKATFGSSVTEFYRPTRQEIADYLGAYPKAVGIHDSIWTSSSASSISRHDGGFHIGSHDVTCRELVLASGTFSHLITPRPLLAPLIHTKQDLPTGDYPLLVVGSGFTAADIIISAPPHQNIVHIFKWAPDEHPSPLRGCHPHAYPEYAGVYRQMKLSAMSKLGKHSVVSPMKTRKTDPFFKSRDWESHYEGLPNTYIKAVSTKKDHASITLEGPDGESFERKISRLEYVIGRRGSLQYLDENLQTEIHQSVSASTDQNVSLSDISGRIMKLAAEAKLEIAPDVFIIGNLTGDSLIRFACGGCVYAAREILSRREERDSRTEKDKQGASKSIKQNMAVELSGRKFPKNNHHHNQDLSIDGNKTKALGIEVSMCDMWRWAEGFGIRWFQRRS
ncbi:hypothetical protein MMC09_001904 [Bachmanniomyces sp. S44760]|nr:hypothetical protein [Bachmanniomyces sp. S44760]